MKQFIFNEESYKQRQSLGVTGIQYEKTCKDGLTGLVFIPGKRHTRQEVIEAFTEQEIEILNNRE